MATKYLKNNEGLVRAVTTDNLQLEKPLTNENYDVNVFNRNMDKVDAAIQEVKGKIDGLELVASNVKMADGTTVEDTVSVNKTSILNNTELVNQALNKANEAFQRGDNVKTQLVDKLISEGLDVSTNNTFEELISSISLGKKWAKGEIQANSTVTVSVNFGFTPKYIMVYPTTVIMSNSSYLNAFALYFGESEYICLSSTGVAGVEMSENGSYVKKSGFSLTIAVSTSGMRQMSWMAFE